MERVPTKPRPSRCAVEPLNVAGGLPVEVPVGRLEDLTYRLLDRVFDFIGWIVEVFR